MPKFKDKIIWCPFDTSDSEFVKVFTEHSYNVIHSHISEGKDFFQYEPEKWDLLISNPPFTGKTDIFKRALSFNKPFALIMSITYLNDAVAGKIFKDKGLQLLSFTARMKFANQPKDKAINFLSAYFCRDFLPEGIIFRDFTNPNQLKLI